VQFLKSVAELDENYEIVVLYFFLPQNKFVDVDRFKALNDYYPCSREFELKLLIFLSIIFRMHILTNI